MIQYSVIPEYRFDDNESWCQCEPEQAEAWSVWTVEPDETGELMPTDLMAMFYNKSAAERHIRLLASRNFYNEH